MNRRKFMSRVGAGTLAISGGVAWAGTAPNVVYIVCDQMRGDALSCLGNPNAHTPNLDRMASQGTLFENWFSNNPVCVPSRVTAFTGLYPHQHGCLDNKTGSRIRKIEGSMLGHFRSRGYRLGWVGKNDTYAKGALRGLDMCRIRAREPFRRYNGFVPPWWHSDMYWPEDECSASLNTRDALEFIDTATNGEPFFLHVSYFDPHPPYFAPAKCMGRYVSADMQIPPYVAPEKLDGRLAEYQQALHYDRFPDADLIETMRYYHAAVEWGVDDQVGRILDALETKGLAENTIVVFTSDHGDFMGHHHMVRKAMFHYDALLHVPMIWFAPGRIRENVRTKTLGQGVDLFPTLVDLTGGKIPKGLPGRSVRPWLEGGGDEDDDHAVFASAAYGDLPRDYFDHPEPFSDFDGGVPLHLRVQDLTWTAKSRTAMVRTREWKLILSETRGPELYHMPQGGLETLNVINEPETSAIRSELEAKLRRVWSW
ncbi:MAG: sulfatase-like hydrolase/transferase [Nitrospiraceae bacterium]|nr:sulfatase-like hydrolase/transferase [Nitrospiraceae bacterium]